MFLVDWKQVYKKISERREILEKILGEKAVKIGETLIIYDEPIEIRIERERVSFYLDDELAAFIDESGAYFIDERVKEEVELWCKALTSLGFKKYRIRR